MDLPPNETIYVSNISDKIRKQELKKALYCIFSQYGSISDVIVMRTNKLRGQAWVVFDEISSASAAVRQMEGFPFFGKSLKLAYAKEKSDAILKKQGKFDEKAIKSERKRKREERERQEEAGGGPRSGTSRSSRPSEARIEVDTDAPPNNALFVQNLGEATADMVKILFSQFPGFSDVRTVPAKPGIAFVHFDTEISSGNAMQGLQGFKITPDNAMVISYARR